MLRDRQRGVTTVLSKNGSSELGNYRSGHAVISANGRVVAFESPLRISSWAPTRTAPGATGITTRVSGDRNVGWKEPSTAPVIASRAEVVAFSSRRPMDERDRGHDFDLFVSLPCGSASSVDAVPDR